MYQLPPGPASGLILAAAPAPVAFLVWTVLCGVAAVVAIIRILRQPAEDWPHGKWSKLGWVLLTLYLAPRLAGLAIPIGAIAAIYRTHQGPTRPTHGQFPSTDNSTTDSPWETK